VDTYFSIVFPAVFYDAVVKVRWEGATTMAGRSSNSVQVTAAWLSEESDSGAALWLIRWPRFSGRVEDFEMFKNQWLKMEKTGIRDQELLRGLWEHCLPPDLTRRSGRLLEVAKVWEWLENFFAYNDLCKVVDEEYYVPKCVPRLNGIQILLLLKTEIFKLYGTAT
jgi:hypothetical protein